VELLTLLAHDLGTLPNDISIEGHTDSKPYSMRRTYDNWDLSSDRANEARRLMQGAGLRADQVKQVRGFADQRLRLAQNPQDPSNRRISLIVQYQIMDASEVDPKVSVANTKVTRGQE
jgi:chemotaxis protein MotB